MKEAVPPHVQIELGNDDGDTSRRAGFLSDDLGDRCAKAVADVIVDVER